MLLLCIVPSWIIMMLGELEAIFRHMAAAIGNRISLGMGMKVRMAKLRRKGMGIMVG